MRERQVVWLLRSRDEPDPYEDALSEKGLLARSIAVLAFERVNESALRSALERPKSYDGLIFTSPRAVEAFADAMSWLPSENVVWHAKPIFAVGPRTADELRNVGFAPIGEESGSGGTLANHILQRRFEKSLLFLCGDRRRDELLDRLHEGRVSVDELCVYETKPMSRLDLTDYPTPDWIVFFSPSGVEAMQSVTGVDTADVRIVAIGPTTASALRQDGYQVDAVATEPSPTGVTSAILRALDD